MNILNVIEVIVAIILIIFIVLLHTSNKKLKLYRVVFLEITLVAILGHVGYNLFFKQPTIEILGDKKIVIEAGRDYEDKGAKAKLRGKDISKTLKVKNEVNPKKPGEYKVYYELIYKNKLIKVERTVYVKDETAPTLKLKGSSTINVPSDSEYEEEGYTVEDDVDGDISKNVKIDKKEINEKQYKIIYTVCDKSGNSTVAERIVNIVNPVKKHDKSKNGYVYLTFDDGPTFDITPKILDILKEENIKATFFVINYTKDKEPLIKRIVEEGHSIGIHGNSHKYAEEYQSADHFMDNVYTMEKKIKDVTGIETKIIRFPGGSSNTVSKYYSVGIMTALTRRVLQEGYRYFDWNIPSGDSGDVDTSEAVYNNVTKNLGKDYPNMVLMHDFSGNKKTVNALRDIIRYCKSNGYILDKIRDDTPMITHKVAN